MAQPQAVHFYHLWLGGEWRQIAEEHFRKLRDSGFPGDVRLGLVGPPDVRAEARAWLPYPVAVEADCGWEDVTINALRHAVKLLRGDTPVLYSHNKGAFHNILENKVWRRDMDDYLAVAWAARMAELKYHDVSAWHWLAHGAADPFGTPVGTPFAAGNFWWARADYLKGLPALPALTETTRIEAESWIGQDSPTPACLSGVWPKITLSWRVPQNAGGMRMPDRVVVNPQAL